MRFGSLLSTVVVSFFCAFPLSASACDGQTGQVVLIDDFTDETGGWDQRETVEIGGGRMLLKATPDRNGDWNLNASFNAIEGDFCAEFVGPSSKPEKGQAEEVALYFLATDYDNFYAFYVDSAGHVALDKTVAGKTVTHVLKRTKFAAVKTGPNAKNKLRVVVKEAKATLYVNGTIFKSVLVQQTAEAGRFGVGALTFRKPSAERLWAVKSFSLHQNP